MIEELNADETPLARSNDYVSRNVINFLSIHIQSSLLCLAICLSDCPAVYSKQFNLQIKYLNIVVTRRG